MKFIKDQFRGLKAKKAGVEYQIQPCRSRAVQEGVPEGYFVAMYGPGYVYNSYTDSGLTFPDFRKATIFCEELASGTYDWQRDVEVHRQEVKEKRLQQEKKDQEAAAVFIEKLKQQGITVAVFLDLYRAFEEQDSSVQKYVYRQA